MKVDNYIKYLDLQFTEEEKSFLKDEFKNYSILDLAYLLNKPVSLLKNYLKYNKIATYKLNKRYPDGYAYCNTCKKILPYSNFSRNKHRNNGCQDRCKVCDSQRQMQRQMQRRIQHTLENAINNLKKEQVKQKKDKKIVRRKGNKVEKYIEFIKENYDKMTAKQIAKALNISESRVFQIASENKIKKPPKADYSSIGCKLCNKCHQVLPYSNFSKRLRTTDGYETYCKKCVAQQRKESQARKVEKINSLLKSSSTTKHTISTDINFVETEKFKKSLEKRYKNKTVSIKNMEKVKSDYKMKKQETEEQLFTCEICHETKKGKEFYFMKRSKVRDTICKKCKNKINRNKYLEGIIEGKSW